MIDIYQQALALLAQDTVSDVNWYPDETGNPRLVRIDLHNGDYLIAGEEDFEGEPAGYTYTIYDSDGEYFTTDGGPDVATFSAEVRKLAH